MLISYAQNFEDIMLWRALGQVKNGTYIDVGANDPIIDSVTKVFYDNGWSGINIEPVKENWEKLLEARPRDVNIQCMAGDREQEILIHEISGTGLSTASLEIAKYHELNGYIFNPVISKMTTLNKILQTLTVTNIHFLKIDVEGFEQQVLLGLNLSIYRPWIIVVESISPLEQKYTYHKWEYLIVTNSYKKVYCDGINNFYIAKEHEVLCEHFQVPPNFFDKFWLWQNHYLIEPNATVQHMRKLITIQEQNVSIALARVEEAENYIKIVEQSFSWRITAPLRAVRIKLIRLKRVISRLRVAIIWPISAGIHGIVRTLNSFLRMHPALFRSVIWLLGRSPTLRSRVIRIARLANLRQAMSQDSRDSNVRVASIMLNRFSFEKGLLEALVKQDDIKRNNNRASH